MGIDLFSFLASWITIAVGAVIVCGIAIFVTLLIDDVFVFGKPKQSEKRKPKVKHTFYK